MKRTCTVKLVENTFEVDSGGRIDVSVESQDTISSDETYIVKVDQSESINLLFGLKIVRLLCLHH